MSGSGSYHTLHCMRPRFPNFGFAFGYREFAASGAGVWDQGEDWSSDNAKDDYDKDMAELGYDIRTGHIDGQEACEIAAQIDKNHCRSGHMNAALLFSGGCAYMTTLGPVGAASAVVCGAAIGNKLDGELDQCELRFTIRKAACN